MELTASSALELVSSFATEWPPTKLQDVQLRRVTGGLVNTLHLLTRSSKAKHEPTCVLIRHFGLENSLEEPPASSTTLTATEQALVYQEMARKGWGARIYGTFPGGRLEEYIDSRPLTAAESIDPDILRDIARSYARLHSLDVPLRKRSLTRMVGESKALVSKRMSKAALSLAALPSSNGGKLDGILRTYNWHQELDWLALLFERHHCRPSIAIGDSNYLNVLIKNFPDLDCQVMLIDYETATHTYRGIDIGGHFNDRMYNWGHATSELTGYDAHGEEERRSFCESYLAEMRELGQDLTEYDTVERLLLEAEIGMMWQIVFTILMCVVFDEEVEGDELFLEGLVHVAETYGRVKGEFLKIYGGE
ncbi:Choline/ethanolamine kinase [Fulvia fulva]|nr:Choline/ethanolamine kinase [Fulvia fulva]